MFIGNYAIKVFNHILYLREQAGETCDWLMAVNGGFITIRLFDGTIRKLCRELKIPVRSCHKLRKTYCSELLDKGVSEKVVQDQMRHADARTTQNHYNYCVKTEAAKREAINTVRKLDDGVLLH